MNEPKTCHDCGTLDLHQHSFEECCVNLVNQLDEAIAEGDALRAERDALRTVYEAAAVYCNDRTVMHEHALIDAVGYAKALAVQP